MKHGMVDSYRESRPRYLETEKMHPTEKIHRYQKLSREKCMKRRQHRYGRMSLEKDGRALEGPAC